MEELLGKIGNQGLPELISGSWMDIEHPDIWKSEHRFPASGVWWDAQRKELHFLSDRLGFSHLYLYEKEGQIAWTSSLIALFDLKGFSFELREDAAQVFFTAGFLPGDMTWMKEVHLLPAASHWVYRCEQKEWKKERYWTWEEMPVLDYSFEAAVDLLAVQFRESVKELIGGMEGQVGVSLSGGLDSRLLLALAKEATNPVAYTFGLKDSWDVNIAAQVAARFDVSHQVFYLDGKNWMDGRVEAIWQSGGMANLMHLHHVPGAVEMATWADYNLNGFFGDVFMNGFRWPEARAVSLKEAKDVLGEFAERSSPLAPFYGKRQSDAYWIDQRGRRFTGVAVQHWDRSLPQLLPFTDFKLLELVYGLPVEYRQGNRMYAAFLMKYFKSWYEDIPWNKTGMALGWKQLNRGFLALKGPQIMRRLGWWPSYAYTDYSKWMRAPDKVAQWAQLLSPKSSKLAEAYGAKNGAELLADFTARKKGGEEQLSRALSVAIWLRQLEERGIF